MTAVLPTYYRFLVSPRIPAELVLKTIQYLPFGDGELVATLRSVYPRLHNIIQRYELSITMSFVRRELRHALVDFACKGAPNLDWLAGCVKKYDVVDDVMDALFSDKNCFAVERHNLSLVNTGLLLLFRLVSIEGHKSRINYLRNLQRDPLIAMYLALHHATLSARYHGAGWIHQRTYGRFMDANQISLRNELEFCFAEACLNHGPDFIADMLLHHDTSNAEATLLNLYHEHGTHDWEWPCWGTEKGEFEPPRTQGPQKKASSKGRSLFTILLETMAEAMECPLSEVRSRVESRTDHRQHPLAHLDLDGKACLLEGLNLGDDR